MDSRRAPRHKHGSATPSGTPFAGETRPAAAGRARFSGNELAVVLSHYDIGIIKQAKHLNAGNPRTPKTLIVSDRGLYLVRRRPHGKGDPYRVAMAHSIREFLLARGYPVAAAVRTRHHANSFLHTNDHIYEMLEYIRAARYDGSIAATQDAGLRLGQFHLHLSEFACEYRPIFRSFHDSPAVRRHLETIGPANGNGDSSDELQRTSRELLVAYNTVAMRVNDAGLSDWPDMLTHGDWHPGNLMFESQKVRVVLDLDVVKLAPAPADLANGLLQFSIVGGSSDPARWPDELDIDRLAAFMKAYRGAFEPGGCLAMLPDLMIETMIAEAVLPVAATGSFGHMCGLQFLRMIQRKCAWLDSNRQPILTALGL